MTAPRSIGISGGFCFDVFLRTILAIIYVELENAEPFIRRIHEDELWLYRNPRTDPYVPTTLLWPLVFIFPTIAICLAFLINKDKFDACQSVFAVTLALGLNGVLTDVLKLIVGRPRPDFYWRCFPDGRVNTEFKCTGNPSDVKDGRMSFPSGHSSFAFASLGFVALYSAGKLHTFSLGGKGQSWKLCIFLFPLCIALAIAISRTCDYHHHWQDVTVGSTIGFCLAYLCYRHYYPPLDSQFCHRPYNTLIPQTDADNMKTTKSEMIKWI
ncbi:phospholipid phosphatase 5 [Orussus abietinus]|uniref:phospholipid phosphatase 5 n=1 Tax=Orussus abietinus TaxID=222816 RepID=UPI0006250A71|nr:phospholipid phosphatase 5 [Orussus abietinus]